MGLVSMVFKNTLNESNEVSKRKYPRCIKKEISIIAVNLVDNLLINIKGCKILGEA